MRVLDLHADHLAFAVTAGPLPEDAAAPEPPTDGTGGDDVSDDGGGPADGGDEPAEDEAPDRVPVPREGRLEDCLAAFVACEGVDAADPAGVAARAAAHLRERARDLRVDAVAVYPFDHLVASPADRETTIETCRALTAALVEARDAGDGADDPPLDVLRAPVGWHRWFSVRTTGHPFAESTARFRPGDGRAGDGEHQPSDWSVVTPAGEWLTPEKAASELDAPTRHVFAEATGEGLPGAPVEAEDRAAHTGPTDATPTERLTEPDGLGGCRVLPAGRLVGDLIEDLVRERALATGASPVETPHAYDLTDPAVARLAGTLGDEWFAGGSDGEADGTQSPRCRPSTRLGFRSLLADAAPERLSFPFRVFESGSVSRRERDGPDHASTVPAVHVATADWEAGWAELGSLASLARDCLDAIDLDAVPVCRAGGAVPEARIEDLAAALDQPLLLARTDGEGVTLELRTAGEPGDPSVTARVELTPAPALDAVPADGALLHCEPVGSLDRVRTALAARAEAGEPLPAWLAPATVRFVPVDGTHRERARELVERAASRADTRGAGLRADIDPRALPVGERLDGAAHLPFVAVVGDREAEGAPVKLLDRRERTERSLSVEELMAFLESAVGDRPRRSRYLPRSVGDGKALRGGGER